MENPNWSRLQHVSNPNKQYPEHRKKRSVNCKTLCKPTVHSRCYHRHHHHHHQQQYSVSQEAVEERRKRREAERCDEDGARRRDDGHGEKQPRVDPKEGGLAGGNGAARA